MTRLHHSQHPLLAVLDTIVWLGLLLVIGVVTLTVITNKSLFGGYRSFVVQSGSMEPAIMTGDIIIIHPQERYQKRDVITFNGEDNRIVTHRVQTVVEDQGDVSYLTKGDANRIEDEGVPRQSDVLGKVVMVVPKMGYVAHFAQGESGFVVFIIVPLTLLILEGLVRFVIHG